MAKHRNYYIRKVHRYLGILLGIQFLAWTAGGLYFSWNDIDEVHGDHLRKEASLLPADLQLASITEVLDSLRKKEGIQQLVSYQLISLLGKPVYQVRAISNTYSGMNKASKQMERSFLVNASTGIMRAPLDKEEAIAAAREQFSVPATVQEVQLLTETNSHHEYRNNPLPAYAIRFNHPSRTTIYVSTELGTVQKFRNEKWRIFDFLWMLHTMDYKGRDDFGNILLRLFSLMGLITVLSGVILFAVTARTGKRKIPAVDRNVHTG